MSGSLTRVSGAWELQPLPLACAALAMLFYLRGACVLRSRGGPALAPAWRVASFAGGLALGVLAVSSPLDAAGEQYLLSAHMAQHLILGDLVPLLLVVGLAGPVSRFAMPRPILRAGARSPAARRALGAVASPLGAALLWCGVMALWHVPAAWEAALRHPAVHDLEHLSFLVAGLAAWWVILDPARLRRHGPGRRAALAALLLGAGMALGEALVLAPPLYPSYIAQPVRLLGLTPSEDQRRAGLLMMAEGFVTFGIAAALLLAAHVERVGRRAVGARPGPPA